MYNDFFRALESTNLVLLTFDSKEKGVITRTCAPMDFGPSRIYSSSEVRYHFIDVDSSAGAHPLSITPDKVVELEILEEQFSPENLVHWQPNWHYSRDWGSLS